jgi:hypothetical protein
MLAWRVQKVLVPSSGLFFLSNKIHLKNFTHILLILEAHLISIAYT